MSFDNILIQLKKETAVKGQLETKLRELQEQRRKYENDVIALREAHRNQQEDVHKLENRSLANYFYNVIGKLDEKLDQERQEAYAAKVRLDAADRELAGIEKPEVGKFNTRLQNQRLVLTGYGSILSVRVYVFIHAGTGPENPLFPAFGGSQTVPLVLPVHR